MVNSSHHNAVANGDNSGERSPDILVQPESASVCTDTRLIEESNPRWWELYHEGIAADHPSVVLLFFEETDAASDAADSRARICLLRHS
jgi:hypothetical protein